MLLIKIKNIEEGIDKVGGVGKRMSLFSNTVSLRSLWDTRRSYPVDNLIHGSEALKRAKLKISMCKSATCEASFVAKGREWISAERVEKRVPYRVPTFKG